MAKSGLDPLPEHSSITPLTSIYFNIIVMYLDSNGLQPHYTTKDLYLERKTKTLTNLTVIVPFYPDFAPV